MTKMQKGFVAMLLTMVLAIGAVASADSRQADGLQIARERTAGTPAQVAEAKPERAAATLKVQDLTQLVTEGERQAAITLEAGAVLQNTSRESLDLREVRVMLQDENGKVRVMGRIMQDGDAKGVLAPGESAAVKILFADVPTEAGPLKMSLQIPNGGGAVINAIGIEIHCIWPPLRCRITITFDF